MCCMAWRSCATAWVWWSSPTRSPVGGCGFACTHLHQSRPLSGRKSRGKPVAFTYIEGNAHASNADYLSAVRFALQDTVESEGEFSDDEITAQYGATPTTDAQ